MVSTRSGKTPSKKPPHKGKATSPLDAKLEDLSLTKPTRKAKRTPRKSLKQSPNQAGAASRRRQNTTEKRKQTKQQLTKERRAAALATPPSLPKEDSKVSALLEHKQRAAEMSTSLLSNINNITAVGPNEINKEMFGFYNYKATLEEYFIGFLSRCEENPELKSSVSIKSEGCLEPGIPGHEHIIERFDNSNLPILCIVECTVLPMNYLANFDPITDTKTFTPFEEAGLKWVSATDDNMKNVNILVSSDKSSAYDLLPLTKPSKIDALKPSMLQADRVHQMLSFPFKGIQIMVRSSHIREDVDDIIEDEKDLSPDDRDHLIQAVEDEKQRQNEKYSAQVNSEKSLFAELVTSQAKENNVEESSIKASLEAMKVYKVYPKYEEKTLPPPKVVQTFCGPQISGDVKNPKYDDRSLFGLVDGFY